jgi:hypothetical protein
MSERWREIGWHGVAKELDAELTALRAVEKAAREFGDLFGICPGDVRHNGRSLKQLWSKTRAALAALDRVREGRP